MIVPLQDFQKSQDNQGHTSKTQHPYVMSSQVSTLTTQPSAPIFEAKQIGKQQMALIPLSVETKHVDKISIKYDPYKVHHKILFQLARHIL